MAQLDAPPDFLPRLVWLTSFRHGGRIEQLANDITEMSTWQPAAKRRRRVWTLTNDCIKEELRRAGCMSSSGADAGCGVGEARQIEGVALVVPGSLWDGCLTPWPQGAVIQRRYFANARDAFTVKILAVWRLQSPHEMKNVISQARSRGGSVFEVPMQFRPSHMVFKPSSLSALPIGSMTACQETTRGQQQMSLEEACTVCGVSLLNCGQGLPLLPVR